MKKRIPDKKAKPKLVKEFPAKNAKGIPMGKASEITNHYPGTIASEHDLLQSVLNSVGKAHIVYLDPYFNVLSVNETYAANCGYRPEEMIGKNHFDLYPGEEVEAIFRKVRDTGQPVEIHDRPFEFPDQPERGVTYWDWTLIPARDVNDNINGLIFSLYETTSRVRAEEMLLQREEQLRATLESIGDGFFTLDKEWRFIYVNTAAEQFIGNRREELLGKSFWDAFPPAVGTEIERRFHLTANGQAQDWENFYEPWGRWYHNRCFPLKGGGISVYFREITSKKKAEQELRESEERYRSLFENMIDGFAFCQMVYDEKGQPDDFIYLAVNDAFGKLTGLKDVTGKRVTQIIPQIKELNPEVFEICSRVALTGRPERFDIDFSPLSLHLSVSVYSHARGFFIAVFDDITERIKLEEKLKKYNETLESHVRIRTEELTAERKRLYDTLETLPVYVILLDMDYRVAFSNKFFRERFGESQGKRCYEFLFNKTAECEGCETYKVMKTKAPHNWEWTGPDGRIYDIYDFPFFEADGSMMILEMGIDITAQKSAQHALIKQQEHLQKLNDELLKSNKELESFAFITSHDLQEPLRMVTSYTQLLAMKYKDQLDENANDYINFAVSGAKRMYDLINDLLDYSRIGRKEISLAKVDINQVIEAVKENLHLSVTEKDCTIEYDNLPDVYADKSQMIHLFQNLIANGIKFNNNSPHIIISAKTEESNYVISVKDNGIGIESQYFDRIFEIFKRLNQRDKFEGTGIGLAICKKIVENHNGKIWVKSNPGEGSAFYITIPVK